MNDLSLALLADYLNGELSPEGTEQLSEALRTDAKFRRHFVLETQLHRQLYDTQQIENCEDSARNLEAHPQTYAMSADEIVDIDRRGLVARTSAASPAPLLLRLMPAISRTAAAPITIVATLFYGTFALLVWSIHPDPELQVVTNSVPASVPITYVATLTDAHDCRWNQGHAIGEKLYFQDLHLISGLAEITFVEGAKVVLEGPAHFALESAARGYLHRGKLVARVPQPAIGFTVQTTTATVIDLGTEFAVEADRRGATDVQVFEGKVEIRAESGVAGILGGSATLVAGSARHIERSKTGGDIEIREIVHAPERFARRIKTTGPIRLPIEGVMASSEFGGREANHLIDSSGLKGEQHSDIPDGSMWLSALGRVKGEFVLFDLGRVRKLDRMKVWNYNENRIIEAELGSGLFKSRGVGQADIYVSTFGRGDPLSTPSDWKAVAVDHKFVPADGTPSYSNPEIVNLDGVEARFVGIVIDDHLGPDVRENADLSKDVVGLSEVQFFGELVKNDTQSRSK